MKRESTAREWTHTNLERERERARGVESEGAWGERMGQQPPAPIPALRDHLGSGFGSRPGEQIRSS